MGTVTGRFERAAKLAVGTRFPRLRFSAMTVLPPLSRASALLLVLTVAAGCGPSNRLREVNLSGERVAIVASIPPTPRVQAGSPAEAGINPFDPIGTAVRVGTAAQKRRSARRAQTRLDSVVARIDVSDRIARQVLAQTARSLQMAPAGRPSNASFVLDLRIADYALVADSFQGATYFVLVGDLRLRSATTGDELWQGRIRERHVVDRTFFGLPAEVGNVVTGATLSRLTSEEMERGLIRLADVTARRISEQFEADYVRSRGAYVRTQGRAGS